MLRKLTAEAPDVVQRITTDIRAQDCLPVIIALLMIIRFCAWVAAVYYRVVNEDTVSTSGYDPKYVEDMKRKIAEKEAKDRNE